MLTDCKAPSNHRSIFPYLIGERVAACFEADGKIWIVTESGPAIVFTTRAGRAGERTTTPCFWVESSEEVERMTGKRRAEIEAQLAEMRDLPGVKLP